MAFCFWWVNKAFDKRKFWMWGELHSYNYSYHHNYSLPSYKLSQYHSKYHPRTYSASRETTWKPTVTDRLVPVAQNYGISSQIISGQLGVWQSSNDDWKHICSKMYISINYVDINIYPLTMECNAPLSMFIWKGRNIKWQYYYYYYYYVKSLLPCSGSALCVEIYGGYA